MKNIIKASLVVLVLVFAGCATADRGNFPQMVMDDLGNSWENSYDIIDTSKEDTNIPKPPIKNITVVERFEVKAGGCSGQDCGHERNNGGWGDRERKELKVDPHKRDTHKGSEYWYTWSIYFPKDFKSIAPAQSTAGQFHSKGAGTDVYYMFVEWNGGYRIKVPYKGMKNDGYIIPQGQLYGKWHTIVIHAKWDDAKNGGFFRVYVDGNIKYKDDNIYFQGRPYFKYGIYRSHISRYKTNLKNKMLMEMPTNPTDRDYEILKSDPITPTQVVYYSNVRRANTKEGLKLSKEILSKMPTK